MKIYRYMEFALFNGGKSNAEKGLGEFDKEKPIENLRGYGQWMKDSWANRNEHSVASYFKSNDQSTKPKWGPQNNQNSVAGTSNRYDRPKRIDDTWPPKPDNGGGGGAIGMMAAR